MSQGVSPWRFSSIVDVGGGGLVDYSNSSDTDDDETPLRVVKEAEDVEDPPVDEESNMGLVGHDEPVLNPDAGIAIGIPVESKEFDATSMSDIMVGKDEKRSPNDIEDRSRIPDISVIMDN